MLSFEQYFSPAGFSRSFYPKYIIQQSLNLDYMYFPPKILGLLIRKQNLHGYFNGL